MAKEKKQKTAMASKMSLNDLLQTHGALSGPRIDYGYGIYSEYKTDSVDEYLNQINAMDNAELYNHSLSLGETPIDNRTKMIGRLEERFRMFRAKNIVPRKI